MKQILISTVLVLGYLSANAQLKASYSDGVLTVNGVRYEFALVEAGTFTMGGTPEMQNPDNDEKPTYQVTLTKDYYIGKTEVTQALWKAVMDGENPSSFKGDNKPIEQVSWYECQTFVSRLREATGKNFRQPTEAEWEFAARGGNKSKHYQYSGSDNIDEVAWYSSNSDEETHDVAKKKPNELGLYDMDGNVSEWCHDWYGPYSSGHQYNPAGPARGSYRVNRGGSWYNDAKDCRSSFRGSATSDYRDDVIGFRLVLSE